ncbi:MAG: ABC transporter permease subunit [Anaerolineales bacterium]|nr:ABC transporter permease subunit [Anaerolineales bacterium]
MEKIKIVLRKEWAEVFKNRMVLFSIIFLPLLLTALPLIILYATSGAEAGDISSEMPSQFTRFCPTNLTGTECFQFYMVSQFLIMFMIIPLMIPVNIAAYSIVGEKTTRSLEPLLATPITTAELLIAKNLAATIPAVIATWIGFGIFAIGAGIIAQSRSLMNALMDPMWLLAIFLVGPLMAILSVNFSIMVSSRVNDPRVAEQVSAVIILPLIGLFFGQISGFILFSRTVVLIMAAVLLVLDLLLIYLTVHIFERESILTRWK